MAARNAAGEGTQTSATGVLFLSGPTVQITPNALKNTIVWVPVQATATPPFYGYAVYRAQFPTLVFNSIALVPVAAILVASIRLRFLDVLLNLGYRGPNVIACDASFRKGEDMGWFQHGSTIIVFAPKGFTLCESVQEGTVIRVGQALMQVP